MARAIGFDIYCGCRLYERAWNISVTHYMTAVRHLFAWHWLVVGVWNRDGAVQMTLPLKPRV